MVYGKQQQRGEEAGVMQVDIKGIEGCYDHKKHQGGVLFDRDLASQSHSCDVGDGPSGH